MRGGCSLSVRSKVEIVSYYLGEDVGLLHRPVGRWWSECLQTNRARQHKWYAYRQGRVSSLLASYPSREAFRRNKLFDLCKRPVSVVILVLVVRHITGVQESEEVKHQTRLPGASSDTTRPYSSNLAPKPYSPAHIPWLARSERRIAESRIQGRHLRNTVIYTRSAVPCCAIPISRSYRRDFDKEGAI